MKNFNINLLSCLIAISGALTFSCKAASEYRKPVNVGVMHKVGHEKCIRSYKPEDFAQASTNLEGNFLSDDALKDPESIILVYEEKASEIKGVCAFGVSREYAGSGYIDSLSVGDKYQGKGIGKALLNKAICSVYEDHGVREITLYSVHSAIPFYKKAGFKFKGDLGTLELA